MSHNDIWRAIERLAENNDLSVSGLAKKAGLDATSFNKSKRIMADGRLRWPSTESVMRILDATQTNWDEFVRLMSQEGAGAGEPQPAKPGQQALPFIHLDALKMDVLTPEGEPLGNKWDEVFFPDLAQAKAFMVEVNGTRLEPFYRDGDKLILSAKQNLRRGDRVLVRKTDGMILVKEFHRQTTRALELKSFASGDDVMLNNEEFTHILHILFASQ
jgi:phage repressor protein C with HTH and peptisase S24 domain